MTNRNTPITPAALVAGLLLTAACGDQASSRFEGEPLLMFDGRVELLDTSSDRALVPALAFEGSDGYWPVLDVEAEGEFPAGFTMSVLDPPPESARKRLSSIWPGEPDAAFAYITAAAPDHGPGFQRANSISTGPDCAGRFSDCHRFRRDFCHTGPDNPTFVDHRGEELPFADCYTELLDCPFAADDFDAVQDWDRCTLISSEGNQELGKTADAEFAGFSTNHSVLYLYAAAPEGSTVAQMFGAPEGLSAGYHLIETRDRTEAEIADADACWQQAETIGFERFMAEHPETTCERQRVSNDPAQEDWLVSCDTGDDTILEGIAYNRAASVELGCPFPGSASSRPADLDSGRITIEIGNELDGFRGDISR